MIGDVGRRDGDGAGLVGDKVDVGIQYEDARPAGDGGSVCAAGGAADGIPTSRDVYVFAEGDRDVAVHGDTTRAVGRGGGRS